jgi:hypothetical protein
MASAVSRAREKTTQCEKGIMKKFLAMSVLALSVAALSQQSASAWVNTKFGAGINFAYQSGGNNFLWGAFRNGQPPAPECPVGCPSGAFDGGYAPAPLPQAPCPPAHPGHGGHHHTAPVLPSGAAPASYRHYNTVTYPNYYPAYYYPVNWYGR